MANQRQRVARKRFQAANPDLFPKPKAPSTDPSSKKKKKKRRPRRTIKGGIEKASGGSHKRHRSSGKHPLRVSGSKPGEGCFICRSQDHIAKLCPRKVEWEKNKICLLCRRRGHSLKNCPDKTEVNEKKSCYNCGQVGHSLSKCPEPLKDGGTKFADCFICNEQGHLSKNCPQNTRGIYPKGGCCKVCGGVTHLAKDCPKKGNKDTAATGLENESVDDRRNRTVFRTVFRSGDELEDDFVIEGTASKKPKTAHPHSDSVPSGADVGDPANTEGKTKKGPKVVNFRG